MGSEQRDNCLRQLSDEFQMVRASVDRVELPADVLSAFAKPVPEYEPEFRHLRHGLTAYEIRYADNYPEVRLHKLSGLSSIVIKGAGTKPEPPRLLFVQPKAKEVSYGPRPSISPCGRGCVVSLRGTVRVHRLSSHQ